MNVILLEPVDKLGEAGALVTVKDGYARNWLIPQGLALPATKSNQAELQARLAQRAKQLAERKSDAERLAEMLKDAELTIEVRAGEGRIYGSVGNKDIAAALKSAYDVEIDRRKLLLGQLSHDVVSAANLVRPHRLQVFALEANGRAGLLAQSRTVLERGTAHDAVEATRRILNTRPGEGEVRVGHGFRLRSHALHGPTAHGRLGSRPTRR